MKWKQGAVYAYLFTVLLLSACNSEQTASAHIFERKQVDSTQLMIKYNYSINDKQYTDSATIDNTVLKHDTITVKVDANSPEKSIPDLKK